MAQAHLSFTAEEIDEILKRASTGGGTGGLDLENLTLSVAEVNGCQRLSMSDGTTTKTVDIPMADIDETVITQAVKEWLTEHPVEVEGLSRVVDTMFEEIYDVQTVTNNFTSYIGAYAKQVIFFDVPTYVKTFTPTFKNGGDTFNYAIISIDIPIADNIFPNIEYLEDGILNCGDCIVINRKLSDTVGLLLYSTSTDNRLTELPLNNALVKARSVQLTKASNNGVMSDQLRGYSWNVSIGGEFTIATSSDDNLSKKVIELDNEIQHIKTKKVVSTFAVIGDSYSTYMGWISEGNIPWYKNDGTQAPENDVSSVKDTWWWKLSKETKLSLLCNESYSGSCVCNVAHGAGEENSFVNRAKLHLGEGNTVGTKPDLIFILGGINDTGALVENKTILGEPKYSDWTEEDLKTFAPAYCYLIDYLMTYNPHTQIVCVIPYNVVNPMKASIKEICGHYGIQYVEFPNGVGMAASHPNKAGMDVIKESIVNALETEGIL